MTKPEVTLAKLPDGTPAKLTIRIAHDLHRASLGYAEVYRETYADAEAVPGMPQASLGSDRRSEGARVARAR